MADDLHYVGGEWYRICDRTGFKIRDVRTKKEWNGLIVRGQSWEPRQPQDLVQGVTDDQTVTEPRPRSTNQFIGPLTTVTTAALAINATIVHLESTAGMAINDTLWIMMDNGSVMVTRITNVVSSLQVQISPGMLWTAAANSQVTDITEQTIPVLT